ncbi:spectrin alpha chain, non-erythrocytic 1-like isoform X3 [Nothobranchius furzeri]|uniref:spectrin alpha chain, non-erythrocytic 1-like isoform X3 n=1 Tax=Nothobranchius furzeri TaxID=105023 RepID=UPI0039046A8B
MAEEAPMVQAQQQEHLGSAPGKTVRLGVQTTANFNSIKELNNRWRSLQQLAEDRSNMLGSAHEVQRFHRDADETKEWIEEKNQALNTDNYGHDLASVQALQREHEGFEHDLAALGDKVRFLIGTRTRVVSGDTFFMVLVTPPQPFLISNQRGAFLFKPTHTPTTGSLLNTSACLQWILKPEPMLTCVLPPPDAELLLQVQPQTYLCTLSSSL